MNQEYQQKGTGIILALICLMKMLSTLMLTMVGVSLPKMGAELHATALQLGLMEQLYVLGLGIAILIFGRLGDLYRQGRLCAWGFLLFAIFTGIIGIAPNIETILVLRFIQGMSVALFLSGSLALVAIVFPPEVRGTKMGIVSIFIYAGLSLGPVIGGLITTSLHWRFIYFLFVPIALIGAILSFRKLYTVGNYAPNEKMDWVGSFFYAVSIALITLGSTRVADGWQGVTIMVVGIVLLVYFLISQKSRQYPLLDVKEFFGNRVFFFSSIAALGNYASTFGMTFFMSLYLQYNLGLSARAAGLTLLVQPLFQVLVSPFVGRLSDKHHPGKIATIGVILTTVGLLIASFVMGMHTELWKIIIVLVFIGIGYGVFITPNVVLTLGSVPVERRGLASAMVGTMRTLGMIVSMTAITIIFAFFMGGHQVNAESLDSFLYCMRFGMIVFAVFSFLGVFSSFKRL